MSIEKHVEYLKAELVSYKSQNTRDKESCSSCTLHKEEIERLKTTMLRCMTCYKEVNK